VGRGDGSKVCQLVPSQSRVASSALPNAVVPSAPPNSTTRCRAASNAQAAPTRSGRPAVGVDVQPAGVRRQVRSVASGSPPNSTSSRRVES
jgi:hypothetical protein